MSGKRKAAGSSQKTAEEELVGGFARSLSSLATHSIGLGTENLKLRRIGLEIALGLPDGSEVAGSFSYAAKGVGSDGIELDQIAIKSLALPRPTYADLAAGYACRGTHDCSMTFPNTCAIRLSEALAKTDSSWIHVFKASGKNLCPHNYVRGAQDLASILASSAGFGVYDFGIDNPGGVVPPEINGKQGVIVYIDIPTFPQGQGHIGLWNKTRGHCGVEEQYWDARRVWFWKLR